MAARKSRNTRIRKEQRAHVEAIIGQLVELCDALDADPDLEPDVDDEEDDPAEEDGSGEPSLGSFDRMTNQVHSYQQRTSARDAWWCIGEDREADSADSEPSLGSIAASGNDNQENWAAGRGDDREDEHDGREPEHY